MPTVTLTRHHFFANCGL